MELSADYADYGLAAYSRGLRSGKSCGSGYALGWFLNYPQISVFGSDIAQGYRKRDRARKMFLSEKVRQAKDRNLRNLRNLRIINLSLVFEICGSSLLFASIRVHSRLAVRV